MGVDNNGTLNSNKSGNESVGHKSGNGNNAPEGAPLSKTGAMGIAKGGVPFSLKADNEWILH